jgi:hypothetical protein
MNTVEVSDGDGAATCRRGKIFEMADDVHAGWSLRRYFGWMLDVRLA